MRLPFWRRREPHWRDALWAVRRHVWPEGREQDGTGRELSERVGRDRRSVVVMVGLADVCLRLTVAPFPGGDYRVWELADVSTDPLSLRAEIAAFLRQNGCAEALSQRVLPFILDELTRLVAQARVERDRRLGALPAAAPVEWDTLSPAPRSGGAVVRGAWRYASANRHGIYTTDAGSIEVTINYVTESYVENGAHLRLVSTKSERCRETGFHVSMDGLCSEGVVQTLETWGWPSQTALGVGRAVALQARADWLSSYPTWSGRRRAADTGRGAQL